MGESISSGNLSINWAFTITSVEAWGVAFTIGFSIVEGIVDIAGLESKGVGNEETSGVGVIVGVDIDVGVDVGVGVIVGVDVGVSVDCCITDTIEVLGMSCGTVVSLIDIVLFSDEISCNVTRIVSNF